MTQSKHSSLQSELAHLYKIRPKIADEVHRLAQNGDFSENAEYQMAKGKLRGINHAIEKIEFELNRSVIIKTASTNSVQVGHSVTVDTGTGSRIYTILGSSETDPSRGIISHASPIGAALLGKKVGDEIEFTIADKKVVYKILEIK